MDVAGLIAGITLPSIERFGSDNLALIGLPEFLPYSLPVPEPPTRASVARSVIADGVGALEALRGLENSLAECKAALVDRVLGAVAVESAATELSPYQSGMAQTGCVAEIAAALCIPERTAATLASYSVGIQGHPKTRLALGLGVLSWRHAVTILQELGTLAETSGISAPDVALFEAKLLLLAQRCTALRFANKARKVRESLFPESLDTRVKEAFRGRKITNEPGKDGMSWLELHIPTIAANAIMVHCTRAARAVKADALQSQRQAVVSGSGEDCSEHRTLDQLRADIATILLMGQELPENARYAAPCQNRNLHKEAAQPASRDGNGTYGRNDSREEHADSAGRGAGGVPFGVSSGCGVALADEPPWAHAIVEPTHHTTQPTWLTGNSRGGTPGVPDESSNGQAAAVTVDSTAGAAGSGDVPVAGLLVGDGSGYIDHVVDGIDENSRREAEEQEAYFEQLTRLGGHPVLVDPPMPKALVMVKVPFLGLLGITDEPAELDDMTAGPVPLGIARRLLAASSTFLRVLTDPVTGAALPLEPDRYTLRDAERSVLQALAGGCYFPNCTNPVLDTELDHVQSFDSGGKSTMENLLPSCRKHHRIKHFKDDKDRKGNLRRWAEPWRTGLRLRGWTPRLCGDGRVGWVSPSGTYRAPDCIEPQRPAYPEWLKKRLVKALARTDAIRHLDRADLISPMERRITTNLQNHGNQGSD
ncbi:hypothetical protein MB46_04515 [Arthrobacter alpinus]|nr:hypothetical protein MB46_04515 [Arthrobacter alpinus]